MSRDLSTEKKIKEAAKKIFQKKGFGLARTRDIAEEAGINLALLNYYYRSKEKLFQIIMEESMKEMISYITDIINNKETTLSEKIEFGVSKYIDELLKNPYLPLFVFSELQANPQELFQKIGVPKNLIKKSFMYQQLQYQIDKKELKISPLQIFINMVSLSIFPIIAKPFLTNVHEMNEKKYEFFIEERRKLIPIWVKTMLKLEE